MSRKHLTDHAWAERDKEGNFTGAFCQLHGDKKYGPFRDIVEAGRVMEELQAQRKKVEARKTETSKKMKEIWALKRAKKHDALRKEKT